MASDEALATSKRSGLCWPKDRISCWPKDRVSQQSKVISFADFRKVFDSIHDGKMLRILKVYNIGEKLVNTIAKIYKTT